MCVCVYVWIVCPFWKRRKEGKKHIISWSYLAVHSNNIRWVRVCVCVCVLGMFMLRNIIMCTFPSTVRLYSDLPFSSRTFSQIFRSFPPPPPSPSSYISQVTTCSAVKICWNFAVPTFVQYSYTYKSIRSFVLNRRSLNTARAREFSVRVSIVSIIFLGLHTTYSFSILIYFVWTKIKLSVLMK